ncbi:MAG: hypothetical protein IT458_04360 [Planctomycetes bacterium]|nr:hypothetical protein [Planctomycetota bacterium]
MLRISMIAATAALAAVSASAQTGRSVVLTSAPVIGRSVNVTVLHPTTESGNAYVMLWSANTTQSTSLGLPFVQGNLLLDPVNFAPFYYGVLGASGATTQAVPIPNTPSLVGQGVDFQSADLNVGLGTIFLADRDANVIVTNGIGTTELALAGGTGTLGGQDIDFRLVTNSDMGSGTTQGLPLVSMQVIRHYGQDGFVEGYAPTFSSTPFNSDLNLFRRNLPARDTKSVLHQTIALPNGYDVAFLRGRSTTANPNDCRINHVVSFEKATGVAKVLLTVTDSALTCPSTTSTSIFQPLAAFSDDGKLMAVTARDSTNSAGAGVPDKCYLIRTDGSNWPSTTSPALDITPAVGAPTQFFDGALFFANETVFAGTNGGWFWAPTDGSAKLASLALPNLGTGQPNGLIFSSSRRISKDRKTVVFPIGAVVPPATSLTNCDLVAITGIDKTGTFTVKNVTGFTTATLISEFGLSAYTPSTSYGSSIGLKASLSPDGSLVAFCAGTRAVPAAATPGSVYVVKTDGSQAGAPVKVNGAGVFDPQVIYFVDVNFLSNTKLVFFAGTASTSTLDAYGYDVGTATVTPLTKTTTGSTVAPFTAGGTTGNILHRGSFGSLNGNFRYFIRSLATTSGIVNNVVGIQAATLALVDITGAEFAAGTAPAIGRGINYLGSYTTDPWFALEFQMRRSPTTNDVFFVAENGAGATTTVFNDANVFKFDAEAGTAAVQLTSYTGTGASGATRGINNLTLSDDGTMLAFARRLGSSATNREDLFVMSTGGGAVTQITPVDTAALTISDGTIRFIGSPVNGIVWATCTGTTSISTTNTGAWFSLVSGQFAPLALTVPGSTLGQYVLLLNANNTNP